MSNIHAPPPDFKPADDARGTIADPMNFSLARACTSLHALGPRAIFEFIAEVEGRHPDARKFIRERLVIYNQIDATHIEILTNSGGFPPPPLYEVPE